jgi:hypothetical protein
MGHVTTPELPSLEGRAWSPGTCGRARAHLSKEERSRAVAMWQHWSSPQQGGEIQSRGTHGGAAAHLSKEVRSGAVGHMAALEPTTTHALLLVLT